MKRLLIVNFERVLDAVRRRLESGLSTFQTLSERGQLLIRKCSASGSNVFGFSFEHIWFFIRMCFIQQSNESRLWSELVHTQSKHAWTKNVLYLVPDEYCI